MAHKESNLSEDTESVKAANHQPENQDVLSDHTDDLPIKEEQKPPTETEMCKTDSNSVWSAGTEALSPTKADNGLASGVEQHDIPESKEEEDGDIKNEDGGAESQLNKKGEKEYQKQYSALQLNMQTCYSLFIVDLKVSCIYHITYAKIQALVFDM